MLFYNCLSNDISVLEWWKIMTSSSWSTVSSLFVVLITSSSKVYIGTSIKSPYYSQNDEHAVERRLTKKTDVVIIKKRIEPTQEKCLLSIRTLLRYGSLEIQDLIAFIGNLFFFFLIYNSFRLRVILKFIIIVILAFIALINIFYFYIYCVFNNFMIDCLEFTFALNIHTVFFCHLLGSTSWIYWRNTFLSSKWYTKVLFFHI